LPALALVGGQLWVSFQADFQSPFSLFILDSASGAVLASNFTAPGTNSCGLLSANYAVCSGAGGNSELSVVYSTSTLPPTPIWSNLMGSLLIAADRGANGQLIATTGSYAQQLTAFDLATGDLVWTIAWPGVVGGSFTVAYDNAGTLWLAWLGYDESQHFTAIVATYDITTTPVQTGNFSAPLPLQSTNAISGLVVSKTGKQGYLTLNDGTAKKVVTLSHSGTSISASIAISAPSSTLLQAIPGPQDGQLIIGELTGDGQPSMTVYV
jgi:hypothetical protein